MARSISTGRVRPRSPRRWLSALAGAIALTTTVALSACSPVADGGAATGATLRIGSATDTTTFSIKSLDRITSSLTFDYLFFQDAEGYRPRAAEFAYTEGNTVLTIKLIKDVTFADGSKLDAELLRKNILFGKDNGAFFTAITKVDVKDDKTVVVTLSQADMNVMLSMWAMPLADAATLADPEKFASDPNESGPYRYDATASTQGSITAFTKNPDYWNAAAYPYEKVTVTNLPDETSRINALKGGQVDTAPVSTKTAGEAKGSGLELTELHANFGGLVLGDRNGKITKAIGDVRVRQAINMALDREAMVKSMYGGFATVSSQAYAPGMAGYQEGADNTYAYDPDGARKLMAEAGYADGFDLTIPTYQDLTRDVEAYLEQALGEIGIRVKYDPKNDDTWLPAFSGGDYAVIIMPLPFVQSVNLADPEFFWNPWHVKDPEAVALLKTINAGTPDEAKTATAALGKRQLDQAWFGIWAHSATLWASKPNVKIGTPQYADWVVLSDFSPKS